MAEGHNSSSGKNVTNDDIKTRVNSIFDDFVSDVDPDLLCDVLIAKQVITIGRCNEIRTEKTTQKKCRKLLLHLLSTTHPTAFLVVRKALKKICPHICEKIEHQTSSTTEEEVDPDHNTRWKEEKEQLVKEMNEERQQWKMKEEVLENRIRELNQELLKGKTEKEVLENRVTELNQELLKWKTEKEDLENRIREQNQELLKWKSEKENPEKRVEATKQSASVNLTGQLSIPLGGNVQGLAKLIDRIFVLMNGVNSVYVFDDEFPFHHQKTISIKKITDRKDMTSSNKTECLYVSDVCNKCIWKIKTDDDQVTEWLSNIDGLRPSVSVTTDGDLIILRKLPSKICLEFYDVTNAEIIGTLPLSGVIHEPLCCIQEPSGDFIISHKSKTEPKSPWVISRLTNDGTIICQFNPVDESQILNNPDQLCHDPDNNRLFVLDYYKHRIVLFDSKSLIWSQILLGKDRNEIENPYTVFYDGKKKQLTVSQNSPTVVSVFTVY